MLYIIPVDIDSIFYLDVFIPLIIIVGGWDVISFGRKVSVVEYQFALFKNAWCPLDKTVSRFLSC